MLVWLLISIVIGAVVSAVTSMRILFWVVSIAVFAFGLPGILVCGIFNWIRDAQDEADYKELTRDVDRFL